MPLDARQLEELKHPDSWTLPAIFRAHGVRVSRCPWGVLFTGIFISLALTLCGYKFWPLVVDTDPDLIWVPPGDDTSQQKTYFDAVFDPFFRVSQMIFTLAAPGAEGPPGDPDSSLGILQARFFPPVVALQAALFAGVAADGTTLEDVCFRTHTLPRPGITTRYKYGRGGGWRAAWVGRTFPF